MQNDAEPKLPEPEQSEVANSPALNDTVEMDALDIPSFGVQEPIEIPPVTTVDCVNGVAAWLTMKSPSRETENEDSLGVLSASADQGILVVADGLGGHRGGKNASRALVHSLRKGLPVPKEPEQDRHIVISKGLKVPLQSRTDQRDGDGLRSMILNRIEAANRRLIKSGSGSATTLALVELQGSKARTYHAGDSQILVMSQRGRIKYETVSHSPVGYALEAGVLSEQEAILHENRHLVSNVIGSRDMSIELGPWISLAARDTILLASDGLFDNLFAVEIVECIRKGSLEDGVHQLAEIAVKRMCSRIPNLPSKPDDLTILAYRRKPRSA
ncbi:PP2C family serine/threonine-protein phosphatase [Thalassoglobus sp. JC818]|uniref:PP2C family protein-serine/threonine phosphatase n=1 Tax=Thalassoglobus sp. JC818 TaxID=3232136 RepID=UPI003457879B